MEVGERWRDGRDGFVLDLDRGVFNPMGYEVVHVREHVEAGAFVEDHHYAGTMRGGGEVFELRHHDRLVGVAAYAQPGGPNVLGAWFPGREKESLELCRLVLLDEVPFNGETYFTARSRELLWREGYTGIVSYSDPMPRDRADGEWIFPGHVGTTYKAGSAIYTGQTAEETQWLFADGTVFPLRFRTKIRAYANGSPLKQCKGWKLAVDRLLAHGAPLFMFAHGDPRAAKWCDDALAKLARRRVHPGQHRYLWAKKGSSRRALLKHLDERKVAVLPYPDVPPEIVKAKLAMQRMEAA